MNRLTNEELAAIRKRAEKATPGPWVNMGVSVATAHPEYQEVSRWYNGTSNDVCSLNDGEYIVSGNAEADADFIAHARTNIPKLIAEVERLHANRDKAVLAIEGICEMICIALSHGESMDLGGVGSELERIREVLLDDHE
jgi:hypothetical protein